MAVAFWLGKDRRLLRAMLLFNRDRHDDHVSDPGSRDFNRWCEWRAAFLALWRSGPGQLSGKACLPAFLVVVAMATSSDRRTASWAAIIALISIVASVMTGERINFLIRACGSMLAAVVWKPRFFRVVAVFAIEGIAVLFGNVSDTGTFPAVY